MKNKLQWVSLGLLLLSLNSFATTISTAPGTVYAKTALVPDTAEVEDAASGTLKMERAGYGIRSKAIYDVYAATLLVSDINKYAKGTPSTLDALNSLSSMKAYMMQIEIVYDYWLAPSLTSDRLVSSLDEALQANGVRTDSDEMKSFLDAVRQNDKFTKGQVVQIAADQDGGVLYVKNTAGKITAIPGKPQFLRDVFSIWLGKPADGGLKDLKAALVK